MIQTTAQQIELESTILIEDLQSLSRLSKIEVDHTTCSNYISVSGNHTWSKLSIEGKQLQSKLNKNYNKFYDLLEVLFDGQVSEVIQQLKECKLQIIEFIQQDKNTYAKTVEEAFSEVKEVILKQVELTKQIYSSIDKPIFIPDTNAILYNIDIEKWDLNLNSFTLCLTPIILSELDKQKTNHKNEDIRRKAETFIRKFKNYRNRGDILKGVPLVGKNMIMAIASEPHGKFFNWLDLSCNDDRFIASVLSIMRDNIRAPIIIITRDANIQNKCSYAKMPFIEPPEPI